MEYPYDNNLLGASCAIWCDTPNMCTEAQFADEIYMRTRATAQKCWNPVTSVTYSELEASCNTLGRAPGYDGTALEVYEAEWYADAVAWAYNKGVVTGDLNTKKFNPNADVTREQLALMIYRYAGGKGLDVTAASDLAGLKNAENTADWALDGVKWAVGAGLISGVKKYPGT